MKKLVTLTGAQEMSIVDMKQTNGGVVPALIVAAGNWAAIGTGLYGAGYLVGQAVGNVYNWYQGK